MVVQDKTKTKIDGFMMNSLIINFEQKKRVKDFYLMLTAQNLSKYDTTPHRAR